MLVGREAVALSHGGATSGALLTYCLQLTPGPFPGAGGDFLIPVELTRSLGEDPP